MPDTPDLSPAALTAWAANLDAERFQDLRDEFREALDDYQQSIGGPIPTDHIVPWAADHACALRIDEREKVRALIAEVARLRAENAELVKHQIPAGWICHP